MGWFDEILASWSTEAIYLLRVLLAGLCGICLGLERSRRLKEAGLRTHFIVACAAAMLMTISLSFSTDTARIAAQIVSGIGFLCAGMIFFRRESLHGLTTAAGVWATAGIGMAMGKGLYLLAIGCMVLIIAGQFFFHSTKIGKINYQQLLLVKFRYSDATKLMLQEFFQVKTFSRFSLLSDTDGLKAEAVIKPQIECSAEKIAQAMESNGDIISIERLEDL